MAPRADDHYDLIDAEPAELAMFGIIESRRQGDLVVAEGMSIFSPSPTMAAVRPPMERGQFAGDVHKELLVVSDIRRTWDEIGVSAD